VTSRTSQDATIARSKVRRAGSANMGSVRPGIQQEVRKFNPHDPRLTGGLTFPDLLAGVAKFVVGAVGGFCISLLLWIHLSTYGIPVLALAAVASIGAFLVATEPARAAGELSEASVPANPVGCINQMSPP